MIGKTARIAGLAILHSLLLLMISQVSPRLIDWPRGVAHGIGMYFLWIFLSIQCLISLILIRVLSRKVTVFLSAGMLLAITWFISQGGFFGPYIAMIGCTVLFCATVIFYGQRD